MQNKKYNNIYLKSDKYLIVYTLQTIVDCWQVKVKYSLHHQMFKKHSFTAKPSQIHRQVLHIIRETEEQGPM
jgi:hypothetical protein